MMVRWKKIIVVTVTIVACVGCDQVTKLIAKTHLPRTRSVSFASDTLRLDYAENKGAILTFEHCLPEKWRGSVFSAGVASFVGMLLVYLVFVPALRPLSAVALSLLCGGILSNLLDRVAFGGDVVDFLNIGWGAFRSGIFNMADVAIVGGTALFILSLLGKLRRPVPKKRLILPL